MARVQDSAKIELEVATLILGILLVMISILTTMPSDVLAVLQKMVLTETVSPVEGPPTVIVTTTSVAMVISVKILYSLLSLLATIPLYLLYLGSRKRVVLIFARTSLILSAYFIIPLLMLFSGLFMFRLISTEATTLINPILLVVANATTMIAFFWIFALWFRGRIYWLPTLKRYLNKERFHRVKASKLG